MYTLTLVAFPQCVWHVWKDVKLLSARGHCMGKHAVSGQRRHCTLPVQTYLYGSPWAAASAAGGQIILYLYIIYLSFLDELLISGLLMVLLIKKNGVTQSWHGTDCASRSGLSVLLVAGVRQSGTGPGRLPFLGAFDSMTWQWKYF